MKVVAIHRLFHFFILLVVTSVSRFDVETAVAVHEIVAGSPVQVNPTAITLPDLRLDGIPLELFTNIVRAAGMSGGIASLEGSCSYGLKRPFVISAGTTLQQALNLIADSTQSKWEINDGAVNMFPASAVPPLLSTKIQSFSWDKTTSAKDTVSKLLVLPEIKQKVQQLGLKAGSGEGGSFAYCIRNCSEEPKPMPIIEVDKDITLLSVLNRIAAAHDRVIWAYLEYHCRNETNYALYISAE